MEIRSRPEGSPQILEVVRKLEMRANTWLFEVANQRRSQELRAIQTLHERLSESMSFMHKKRWSALWRTVEGLVTRRGSLWLTALGRARSGAATPKHSIKAVDRLLSNPILFAERDRVYAAVGSLVIARGSRPVILVDTTEIRTTTFALTASVAFEGRAFPLLASVVHGATPAPSALTWFLARLAKVLPADCRPILISDAGFGTAWFAAVKTLGWDYVGRVRGRIKASLKDGKWAFPDGFHRRASKVDKDLGPAVLCKSTQLEHRLVLSRRPKRRTKRKRRTRRGGVGQSLLDKKHSRASDEPWLLATSLTCRPHPVVQLYGLRMQIEENYRDAKNHRWGWSLRSSRTRDPARIEILLLIAAVAVFVQQALGVAAEAQGLHRRHQANTVKNRRVLSFFLLGRLVAQDPAEHRLSGAVLRHALARIRQTIRKRGLL